MATNELYPIFLKVNTFNILIIGGGNVGLEKLSFLLKSSPRARVSVLSDTFNEELRQLAERHEVPLLQRSYAPDCLEDIRLVIACTDRPEVNRAIYLDCQKAGILANVADTPDLCDFYMGGIVTKGSLKVAISTNGKSPTLAKRLRQFFETVLPEDLDELASNLNAYRNTLSGTFEDKVRRLNEITKGMVNVQEDYENQD